MKSDEEIEGFNYAPIGGMEVEGTPLHRTINENSNPADLFKGEMRKWKPPEDLDSFFERFYHYYCEKGFWCIVIQWIVELLTLGFTILFSGFLLLVVDWHGLFKAKCGVIAAEEGLPPCNLLEEAVRKQPLQPFTFARGAMFMYFIVFSFYWLFCFARFFLQLRDIMEIRDFCHNFLDVSDQMLQTMTWPALVDQIVALQNRLTLSSPGCKLSQLSAHGLVSCIMRRENYLIGMLNKGALSLTLPAWLPCKSSAFGGESPGGRRRGRYVVLTKTVEWSLTWCLFNNMFDRNRLIRKDFVKNPVALRRRFKLLGGAMLLLSPFVAMFLLIYFFLRNAEQLYHQPSSAGSRRWSNLARWRFREFNELEHMLKLRLNASYPHAVEYMQQFPSPCVSMLCKFAAFVSGAFAAVLLVIAFVDESLLEAQLWGRNLFWYAAVLGAVLAVSRSLIMEEYCVFDPEERMRQVAEHTHCMPKHWRGPANRAAARAEFEGLFQYKAVLFFEEMLSVFITPFLLLFCYPKCVERMLRFVENFTTNVESVGDICSLSAFDFEHHGNSKYGSPFHVSKGLRSSQGKMEKSFISFKNTYTSWQPSQGGKLFLSCLQNFQNQQAHSPPPRPANRSLPASFLQPFVPVPSHLSSMHLLPGGSTFRGSGIWHTEASHPRGASRRAMPPSTPCSFPVAREMHAHSSQGGSEEDELPSPVRHQGPPAGNRSEGQSVSASDLWSTRYPVQLPGSAVWQPRRAPDKGLPPGCWAAEESLENAMPFPAHQSGPSDSTMKYEHANQMYWLDRYYMSKSDNSVAASPGDVVRGSTRATPQGRESSPNSDFATQRGGAEDEHSGRLPGSGRDPTVVYESMAAWEDQGEGSFSMADREDFHKHQGLLGAGVGTESSLWRSQSSSRGGQSVRQDAHAEEAGEGAFGFIDSLQAGGPMSSTFKGVLGAGFQQPSGAFAEPAGQVLSFREKDKGTERKGAVSWISGRGQAGSSLDGRSQVAVSGRFVDHEPLLPGDSTDFPTEYAAIDQFPRGLSRESGAVSPPLLFADVIPQFPGRGPRDFKSKDSDHL